MGLPHMDLPHMDLPNMGRASPKDGVALPYLLTAWVSGPAAEVIKSRASSDQPQIIIQSRASSDLILCRSHET